MKAILATTLIAALLGAFHDSANARQAPLAPTTLTYTLDDIWLLPDVTRPYDPPQQMTGAFHWTYTPGDFENGTGVFSELYIPWYGSDIAALDIMVELNQIEFTLPGNYHSWGVDLQLKFVNELNPNTPAIVDTVLSKFEIWNGPPYQGHVIGGEGTPQDTPLGLTLSGTCPSVQFQIDAATPNSQVALLYAFGTGGFIIPANFPCAGTMLGLDATTQLGTLLTTDALGASYMQTNVANGACGNVYLQVLDLATCEVSAVVLLQ